MRLGGWESLDTVLRYTRSMKLKDSWQFCHGLGQISQGYQSLSAILQAVSYSYRTLWKRYNYEVFIYVQEGNGMEQFILWQSVDFAIGDGYKP